MNQIILSKEIQGMLKSLARRIAGKRKDLQDDLVQEGYLILQRLAEVYDFQRCDSFGGFAYVALKHALPRIAKSITQVFSSDEYFAIDSLDEREGYEAARYVLDYNLTPSERYEFEDSRRAIRESVKLLPRNERRAVSLFYGLDGLYERPYCSIAEELDCSVEGARKAVDRSVNKLRAWYGGPDYRLCA